MQYAREAAIQLADQVWNDEDGLQVRDCSEKGGGVVAMRPFGVGDLVVAGAISEVLPENNSHASQIGEGRFALFAGLFNLVNHSCEPNCGLRVNETGAYDLIAIREIDSHEQVTFDYAMGNYSIDHFPEVCLCGAANCRVRVTGWKDLPREKKKAYQGVAAPYLLDLD